MKMRGPCESLIPLNGCKGTHFFSFHQIFLKKIESFRQISLLLTHNTVFFRTFAPQNYKLFYLQYEKIISIINTPDGHALDWLSAND